MNQYAIDLALLFAPNAELTGNTHWYILAYVGAGIAAGINLLFNFVDGEFS